MRDPSRPSFVHVLWDVLRRSATSWHRRKAVTQAAAISFFALFSLAPILMLVIAIAGAAFGDEAVRGQLVERFQDLMGRDAAETIETMLAGSIQGRSGPIARVLGAIAFVAGATAVFGQLQRSLNRMWNVAPQRGRFLRRLLFKRLLSFALVIAIGLLLMVSLALSAAVAGLRDHLDEHWRVAAIALDVTGAVLSVAIFTVLFAVMYRVLPDVHIRWHDVWLGAFVTALLLTLGRSGIGWYLGHADLATTYGAASSVVVILFWIYLAALLILFGAVFTRVWYLRTGHEKPSG